MLRTLWVYTNEFTNTNTFTNRSGNNITDKFTWRDFSAVQPETALHTYLDDITGKLALFSWKAAANLKNLLLVMILWEYSIDLQRDLAITRFRFSTWCNLSRQNMSEFTQPFGWVQQVSWSIKKNLFNEHFTFNILLVYVI